MQTEEKKLTGYPSIDKPWEKGKSFFEKNPILPHTNIYKLVKFVNMRNMDSPAITCHEKTYTYRELLADAVKLSNVLIEEKVEKGDIITVCMPNIYEAVVIFFACNRIGAIFTCLNSNASINEIDEYISLYHSKIVFTNRNDIHSELKEVSKIIVIGEKVGTYSFENFIAKPVHKRKGMQFNAMDDALILYTSGTTGKPKSVVLTNENIIAALIYVKNTANDIEVRGNRTLICVPFAYPYGFVTSLLTSLLWKKEAILAPFIGANTVEYYFKQRPNFIFGSPALLNLMMQNISSSLDLSFVTQFLSGGDFLTPTLMDEGKDFFIKHGAKIEIGNGCGNAETVSCGTNPIGVKSYPSTAGKLLVGLRAMVVNPETYIEVKYGEEGLLLVSGKHVFKEYYNEPEQTKKAKIEISGNEYFITGTMGFIDKNGYFTVTGRQSRFYINASLNKVYLDHVQRAINNLECVEVSGVVQVPDKKELFVNKAYIVLKSGYERKDGLENYIKSQLVIASKNHDEGALKSYEVPSYIEFVDDIPLKEGTEKVDYKKLEELAETSNF